MSRVELTQELGDCADLEQRRSLWVSFPGRRRS
ncbi:MAG: hypothetical protein QOG75_7173, partial [Mycobacterium sp.]|nr:hypothetical protein [Mycobacterium sp.]